MVYLAILTRTAFSMTSRKLSSRLLRKTARLRMLCMIWRMRARPATKRVECKQWEHQRYSQGVIYLVVEMTTAMMICFPTSRRRLSQMPRLQRLRPQPKRRRLTCSAEMTTAMMICFRASPNPNLLRCLLL